MNVSRRSYRNLEHSTRGTAAILVLDYLPNLRVEFRDRVRVGLNMMDPDTFLPHVGLWCWFNLDDSEYAETGLLTMLFLRTSGAVQPAARFIQEAVDAFGAEPLVERFIKDAKNPLIPWRHVRVSLGLLSIFTLHPAFVPLAASGRYNLLRVFADTAARSLRDASPGDAWDVWLECFLFLQQRFNLMNDALRSGPLATPSILPGKDIVSLLGCGIQLFIREPSKDTTNLGYYNGPTQMLIQLVQKCKKKPGQHTDDLRRDVSKGAHASWYPTLRLLRSEQQRSFPGLGKPLQDLIQLWTSLGTEVGLSELRERDRYEREGLRHCAWKLCRYHIEKPESALSACQGCGEARYCGRTCQTKFAVGVASRA
ncbi:hypothetical protein OF83DRAFT_218764 [Amylostereum chailletii]|nr:hypothetical protein OF83DRAFT_218764 [Amylostereum chailletii]